MTRIERTFMSERRSSRDRNVRTLSARASSRTAEVPGSLDGGAGSPSLGAKSALPGPATQGRTRLPACRQKNQPDIGDAEVMPSESVDTDEARGSGNDASSLGLSQVLGRILQQLSVSAWMPAAMLVGNVSVQIQLRSDGNYNFARAIKELAGKPLGTIIIIAFALILATIVTQAFEFEVIRLLEGYVTSSNGVVQAVVVARIRRHENKRRRLKEKREQMSEKVLQEAVSRMHDAPGYDKSILRYMLQKPAEGSEGFDERMARQVSNIDWRLNATSARLYPLQRVEERLGFYPREHRMLPTRLGNVLRASEDKINLPVGENLQGYVIRHYDRLSPALQSQHDEYRTRLDMYCSLALVFSMLVVIAVITLSSIAPAWGAAVAVAGYGWMAWVSYEAAIATARNYGLILQEISLSLPRLEASDKTR